MNNIEITDEMVKRGCDWYYGTDSQALFHNRETMRKILEAALNPPPEPEIVVTHEMAIAGQALALKARNQGACGDADLWVLVKAIYRAMRKLEPKA